jgi:DNA-binding CsgD family transcriptional regulator
MNKFLRILIAVIALLFFIMLFWFSGASIRWLIDAPTAIALIVGTILITCLRYKNNMESQRLQNIIHSSLAISAVITLSTGVIGVLSLGRDIEFMINGFGVAFITVPYTLVLWIGVSMFFHLRASKKSAEVPVDLNSEPEAPLVTETDDFGIVRDYSKWQLTPRETEIVEQLLLGKSNREIASVLFISETTVKRHLANVFIKTNVASRQALMAEIHRKM